MDPAHNSEQERKPRHQAPMVNVYNSNHYKPFKWHGGEIKPGCQGRIPNALFEKVKHSCRWLKRAERGDVL